MTEPAMEWVMSINIPLSSRCSFVIMISNSERLLLVVVIIAYYVPIQGELKE